MSRIDRKKLLQGFNESFNPKPYSPLDDMAPEVQQRINRMPASDKDAAIEQEVDKAGLFDKLKYKLKTLKN